jgi:hypothetical protein
MGHIMNRKYVRSVDMKKLYPLFIAIISTLFTVSCVTKEVPVTETYYETEYKNETHSENQDVAVQNCGNYNISPKLQWWEPHVYAPNTTYAPYKTTCDDMLYFGYELPYHDTKNIKITFQVDARYYRGNVYAYDLGEIGHISKPPPGRWVIEGNWQLWTDLPGSHAIAD